MIFDPTAATLQQDDSTPCRKTKSRPSDRPASCWPLLSKDVFDRWISVIHPGDEGGRPAAGRGQRFLQHVAGGELPPAHRQGGGQRDRPRDADSHRGGPQGGPALQARAAAQAEAARRSPVDVAARAGPNPPRASATRSRASTPSTCSTPLWWVPPTTSPTPPPSRWPRARPRPTTRSLSTGASGWARPT